jgi:hypothetical protein
MRIKFFIFILLTLFYGKAIAQKITATDSFVIINLAAWTMPEHLNSLPLFWAMVAQTGKVGVPIHPTKECFTRMHYLLFFKNIGT